MIDVLKCLESDTAFEGDKLKFKSQSVYIIIYLKIE